MPETNLHPAEVPSFRFADGFDVGNNTAAYITRMRQPVEMGDQPSQELLVGDILRRTCRLGGNACAAQGCQAPEEYDNKERLCSDLNLSDVAGRMGIHSSDLLMVGVTKDGVGYYDQLDTYAGVSTSVSGIRGLAGYNAFFAKASENVVLGARLADCGFAAIEFKDDEGEDVVGFVHLTKPNLQGESALRFEVDGQPAGCFEYFLDSALKHYGGDVSSVQVRTVAAIKGENYHHTFTEEKHPEQMLPGWIEQGMLKNLSNPDWCQGDPIDPTDIWEPDYRAMVRWQIERSGLSREQIEEEGMIDPADLELGHASNRAGKMGKMPEGRDAYMVMPRSYLHQ